MPLFLDLDSFVYLFSYLHNTSTEFYYSQFPAHDTVQDYSGSLGSLDLSKTQGGIHFWPKYSTKNS